MIVYKSTKGFEIQSHRPNVNWVGDDVAFLVNDSTELANKIIEHSPHFEFVINDLELVDIVPIEKDTTEEEILNSVIPADEEVRRAEFDVWFMENSIELGVI